MENIPDVQKSHPDIQTVDTPLNTWVKNLDYNKKRLFYRKLFNNKLFTKWSTKQLIRRKWDNYRKEGITRPDFFDACLIYVTARYVDFDLRFSTIFPYIPYEWAASMIPALIERSLETDNFSNLSNKDAENFKKQDY